MPRYDEETPLLGSRRPSPYRTSYNADNNAESDDIHQQFCLLAGVPPSNIPPDAPHPKVVRRSLYGRAIHRRNAQNRTYLLTASLSNTLLLSQVVLGAALTGLGASGSSHIIITVLGALNTIIAGVVAYVKSRGQPMRARMFRDEMDRVVDEIENSEIMWLGIQQGVHGYDEIAIDDTVSVRSEVARLTRLYDKVVKNNTMNDPDMYMNAVGDAANAALRARPAAPAPADTPPAAAPPALPPVTPAPTADPAVAGGTVIPPVATPDDPDASPASKPPKPKAPEPPVDTPKEDSKVDAGPDGTADTKPGAADDAKPDDAAPTNGGASSGETSPAKPPEEGSANGDAKKSDTSNGTAT